LSIIVNLALVMPYLLFHAFLTAIWRYVKCCRPVALGL